jgi:hypothetical protein
MNNYTFKTPFQRNYRDRALILFATLVICSCTTNIKKASVFQDSDTSKILINNQMNGKELAYNLEKSGYFKYTDNDKSTFVRDSIIKHFDNDKEFMSEFNSKPPFQSYDLRFYDCGDGEGLYEEGGVINLLKEMQPFFDKNRVKLNYSDDNYINNFHSIKINGRTYAMAEGSSLMWGETMGKFVEMVNFELQDQHSTERLYLITNENEYMIFLTQEQYDILIANLEFDKRPLTAIEWVKNKTEEMNRMINR